MSVKKRAKRQKLGSGEALGLRLVDACKRSGAPDLKAFHAMLVEAADTPAGFPTYAAILTYHGAPWRDPPAIYLARIIEVFPVIDAVWLLTGSGEPLRRAEPDRTQQNAIRSAFTEATGLQGLLASPSLFSHVEGFISRLLSEWVDTGGARSYTAVTFDARRLEIVLATARMLGKTCMDSFRALRAPDAPGQTPSSATVSVFVGFATRFLIAAEELIPAMAHSLDVPPPKKGKR